jgi:hypothetical protein
MSVWKAASRKGNLRLCIHFRASYWYVDNLIAVAVHCCKDLNDELLIPTICWNTTYYYVVDMLAVQWLAVGIPCESEYPNKVVFGVWPVTN